MIDPYHIDHLTRIIGQDHTLTPEEKTMIMNNLHNPDFFSNSTKAGIAGGSVGLAISKFLELPKRAQVLLTLAGYGIGKYLLVKSENYDRFMSYDEKRKVYKINE